MTLTKAIKTARLEVGQLLPCNGQWSMRTYDFDRKGWRESNQMSYSLAQAVRSSFLINRALIALGMSLEDANYYSEQYSYGSWVDFVRKHAKKMRQENALKAMFQSIN